MPCCKIEKLQLLDKIRAGVDIHSPEPLVEYCSIVLVHIDYLRAVVNAPIINLHAARKRQSHEHSLCER